MNNHSTAIAPRSALLNMLFGYRLSQLIFVAAQLNIADMLKEGPKHYQELAKDSGVDPISLYRCLRALASADVFTRLDGDRFELNAVSEFLCDNVPASIKALALYNAQTAYPTWSDLLLAVRTGRNAFEQVHGMSAWEYREQHPAYRQVFDAAMSGLIAHTAAVVADTYDFSKFQRIVDVAGGQGVLLATILKAYPAVHGILFDQAQVVAGATKTLEAAGVLSRCELVGGSFFEAVPSGGDAYILSHIIHDWDDAEALQILKNCRAAMQEGQSLLLVERVIDPDKPRLEETLSDLQMMVALGGCERTRTEYEGLLRAAGFQLTHVIQTQAPDSIAEAKAV